MVIVARNATKTTNVCSRVRCYSKPFNVKDLGHSCAASSEGPGLVETAFQGFSYIGIYPRERERTLPRICINRGNLVTCPCRRVVIKRGRGRFVKIIRRFIIRTAKSGRLRASGTGKRGELLSPCRQLCNEHGWRFSLWTARVIRGANNEAWNVSIRRFTR